MRHSATNRKPHTGGAVFRLNGKPYDLVLAFVTVSIALAADLRVMPGDELRTAFADYLTAQAQEHIRVRAAEVARLDTPAKVRARQAFIRKWLVDAMGSFPEKTALNPRITRVAWTAMGTAWNCWCSRACRSSTSRRTCTCRPPHLARSPRLSEPPDTAPPGRRSAITSRRRSPRQAGFPGARVRPARPGRAPVVLRPEAQGLDRRHGDARAQHDRDAMPAHRDDLRALRDLGRHPRARLPGHAAPTWIPGASAWPATRAAGPNRHTCPLSSRASRLRRSPVT